MEKYRELAKRAIEASTKHSYDYNIALYYDTNENLKSIFDFYDVKDKDVLTVLASSDQLFSCKYNGARSIDTFDKNQVTLYYYYLRKWYILYYNMLYPPRELIHKGSKELYELICNITPESSDELEAIKFWKLYFEATKYKINNYLFNVCSFPKPKPFKEAGDLRDFFKEKLNFENINLFNDINIKKQYDVLILSNILEYARRPFQIEIMRKNIEKLLKKGGTVICSAKMDIIISPFDSPENDILTKGSLKKDKLCKEYNAILDEELLLAYSYKKR